MPLWTPCTELQATRGWITTGIRSLINGKFTNKCTPVTHSDPYIPYLDPYYWKTCVLPPVTLALGFPKGMQCKQQKLWKTSELPVSAASPFKGRSSFGWKSPSEMASCRYCWISYKLAWDQSPPGACRAWKFQKGGFIVRVIL